MIHTPLKNTILTNTLPKCTHLTQIHPNAHNPETPTHNPETPTHTQILSIYTHTSLSISLTHKHTEPHSHSPSQIHPLIHIRNIQIHPLWTTKTHSHPHASSRYAPLPSRNVCKFTHTHPPKYIQLSHILCVPGALPHTLHWPDTPNVLILSTPPRCTHIPNSYFLPSNVPQTLSSTHLIRLYTY